MPVNESQETLRALAQIWSELGQIQTKGAEIFFNPNLPLQEKMLFIICYSFRLNQLKSKLNEIEENTH